VYLEHFGLTEAPFRITPHTDFFFEGANRGATLEALLYAITHDEGIVKVTGEVGSGKTMLCRVLIERLPANVATIYLANPSLSRDEFLFTVADELFVNLATNRISAVLRALQEHLIELYGQGRQVVMLIDEAHAMPRETLEEIRLLSNLESNRHKLLQIVLFGQPELNDNLNRQEMRQLKERITHNFGLEPLVRADVAAYINFRMRAAGYKGPDPFSPAAVKLIARASLGLTRRINILCDKALLAAFAENAHQITLAHIKAAVRDAEFRKTGLPKPGRWIAAGAAAMLLSGSLAAYYWQQELDAATPSKIATTALVATPPTMAPPTAATPSPPVAAPVAHPTARALSSQNPAPRPATTAPTAQAQKTAPPAHPAAMPVSQAGPKSAAESAKPSDLKLGPTTRQKIEETQLWLANADGEHWFIQLLATDASQTDHVENFLTRAGKLDDPSAVRAYLAEVDGVRRIGVIFGDYPSPSAASRALARLPQSLHLYGPYLRQVKRLRR